MGESATTCKRPPVCIGVGVVLILYVAISVIAIIWIHLNRWAVLAQADLLKAHVMCGAFGTLGAALGAIRKYYRSLITETTARSKGETPWPVVWDLGWVYYYLTRPMLGGVLGALTYTFSFVGIHVLAGPTEITISSEGRFLLYGIAFLSGFAASRVLDKLDAVSRQLFHDSRTNENAGD